MPIASCVSFGVLPWTSYFVSLVNMARRKWKLLFINKKALAVLDRDTKVKWANIAKELGLSPLTANTVLGKWKAAKANILVHDRETKAWGAKHVALDAKVFLWFKQHHTHWTYYAGTPIREKVQYTRRGFETSIRNSWAMYARLNSFKNVWSGDMFSWVIPFCFFCRTLKNISTRFCTIVPKDIQWWSVFLFYSSNPGRVFAEELGRHSGFRCYDAITLDYLQDNLGVIWVEHNNAPQVFSLGDRHWSAKRNCLYAYVIEPLALTLGRFRVFRVHSPLRLHMPPLLESFVLVHFCDIPIHHAVECMAYY